MADPRVRGLPLCTIDDCPDGRAMGTNLFILNYRHGRGSGVALLVHMLGLRLWLSGCVAVLWWCTRWRRTGCLGSPGDPLCRRTGSIPVGTQAAQLHQPHHQGRLLVTKVVPGTGCLRPVRPVSCHAAHSGWAAGPASHRQTSTITVSASGSLDLGFSNLPLKLCFMSCFRRFNVTSR